MKKPRHQRELAEPASASIVPRGRAPRASRKGESVARGASFQQGVRLHQGGRAGSSQAAPARRKREAAGAGAVDETQSRGRETFSNAARNTLRRHELAHSNHLAFIRNVHRRGHFLLDERHRQLHAEPDSGGGQREERFGRSIQPRDRHLLPAEHQHRRRGRFDVPVRPRGCRLDAARR